MKNLFQKQIDGKIAIIIIVAVFIIASGFIMGYKNLGNQINFFPPEIKIPFTAGTVKDFEKFASEEEFKSYLREAAANSMSLGGGRAAMPAAEMGAPTAVPSPMGEKSLGAERVSETNVQVSGVDEPDVVKTDGKEIYFSPGYAWPLWGGPVLRESMPVYYQERKVEVIAAFPPESLASEAKIDKFGDLLLANNVLVVFSESDRTVYGYNVSNPQSPAKKWDVKLENNNSVVSSRLYKNKIYLVTKTGIDYINPCPLKPLSANGAPLTIDCREIYRPSALIPADVTYSAFILDPGTGKIEKTISFVGSSDSSMIYMSEKAIYSTYYYTESMVKFLTNFFKEKGKDIIPSLIIQKLEKLDGYDISSQAKYMELQLILDNYQNSLGDDERLKVQNELSNRLSDYMKERKRDLDKTGIVKIGLDNFQVVSSGNVPGRLLNQFSLDEYNDYLRVATTLGGGGWWFGIGGSQTESASDVYVLDKNLKTQGSVKDLGLTERIYSVRFIEDKGYVVTFRQTDPFYVLDLSNPKKPALAGELKIPGYSSYLDPIAKDRVLGVGQENWQVKISLFDVSSAENPTEKAKYILDEGWSDVLSTHHAFLLDKKHQIFFLPGSKGGYVFSYKDDKLELLKAVSGISARRAIYINDYLYIIGDDKIVVLNELNWERVKELEL